MKLHFGEIFKKLRKEKELTQEKIAEVLGVSCQSISRWELGVCYPDLELLPTIANYFGVTTDRLLLNDDVSKQTDKKLFLEKKWGDNFASEEHIKFIESYCHKYPDDEFYAWCLAHTIGTCIIENRENNTAYLPIIRKTVERLLDTRYREDAIELMIAVCDEDELDEWLELCPYGSFNRRGSLVLRYNWRRDNKQIYIQQGLETLENLANQLDRRYPDSFGPEKKAKFHYNILRTIASFGDGIEPPDGWKLFYSYKQLVLSACLFGAGKTEEGFKEFKSAINKYKYIFELKDEYLDLGGELFSNLKVNKDWTVAISEDEMTHKLFAIQHLSFYDADFLYTFLNDPRWAWFDSVRNTPIYIDAVEWAKGLKK